MAVIGPSGAGKSTLLMAIAGFLMPALHSSSTLGTGLSWPYFITMGDSRDLTVTPYVTTKGGRTLELRYRQAFQTGAITITGATSRDEMLPGEQRGYLRAEGDFALPRDFTLSFQAEAVSDPAYLLDYGISDKDRLDSRIEITRTRRNEYISARLIGLNSIREGEDNATLPATVADLTWQRRFTLGPLGGNGGLQFQTHAHQRSSDEAVLDVNGDGIADGRDMQRISLRADWRRSFVLHNGIEASVLGETTADFYMIGQDALYSGSNTRLHGALATELRWPWVKAGANGVSHVIEPVSQLVMASKSGIAIPNEDSALVEFDEGNLFDLSRFPGSDAVEGGYRANLGISYLRDDPAGWTLGVTVGRVKRADDIGKISNS